MNKPRDLYSRRRSFSPRRHHYTRETSKQSVYSPLVNVTEVQEARAEWRKDMLSQGFNLPCPESVVFRVDNGSVCATADVYLYDPCNCDPGHWCGCMLPEPDACFPFNPDPTTKAIKSAWIGKFTNPKTGEGFTGPSENANGTLSACPPHTFCPGLSNTTKCPGLCPSGWYCPTPAQALDCPPGTSCLLGSMEPGSCPAFTVCSGENNQDWGDVATVPLTIGVCLALIIPLLVASCLYGRARANRAEERVRKLALERDKATAAARLTTRGTLVRRAHTHTGLPTTEEGTEVAAKDNRPLGTRLTAQVMEDNQAAFQVQPMRIEFKGLGRTLASGKCILRGVSGALPAGEVTAVMGPSGAGKTTFLSVLTGKARATCGSVFVNGNPGGLDAYRGLVGFVPQDDVLYNELTVEQNIQHSANMRLPSSLPYKVKQKVVDWAIDLLELSAVRSQVVGDVLKRGISGGQRKRVNIALELVAKPSVLFLDEPTSGLDSTMSETVMKALRRVAREGTTVAMVIHQPRYEIFEMFDNVLFLAVGGTTVYMGPTKDVGGFFGLFGHVCPQFTNPADFYLDMIAAGQYRPQENSDPEPMDEWAKAQAVQSDGPSNENSPTRSNFPAGFKRDVTVDHISSSTSVESEEIGVQGVGMRVRGWGQAASKGVRDAGRAVNRYFVGLWYHLFPHTARTSRHAAPWYLQFLLFLRRAIYQRMQSPLPTLVIVMVDALTGAILGLTFRAQSGDLYVGVLPATNTLFQLLPVKYTTILNLLWIMTCLGQALVACTAGCTIFGSERAQYFREASTGASTSAYFLAKDLEALPWIAISSCLFAMNLQAMVALRISFWQLYVVLLGTHYGMYALGMLASIVIPQGAMYMAALGLGLVHVVLTGYMPAYDSASNLMRGVMQASFTFQSSAAYNTANLEFYQSQFGFNVTLTNTAQAHGSGAPLGHFWLNMGLCVVIGLVWRLLALIALKVMDYKKQK